jgi:hypothetical protein
MYNTIDTTPKEWFTTLLFDLQRGFTKPSFIKTDTINNEHVGLIIPDLPSLHRSIVDEATHIYLALHVPTFIQEVLHNKHSLLLLGGPLNYIIARRSPYVARLIRSVYLEGYSLSKGLETSTFLGGLSDVAHDAIVVSDFKEVLSSAYSSYQISLNDTKLAPNTFVLTSDSASHYSKRNFICFDIKNILRGGKTAWIKKNWIKCKCTNVAPSWLYNKEATTEASNIYDTVYSEVLYAYDWAQIQKRHIPMSHLLDSRVAFGVGLMSFDSTYGPEPILFIHWPKWLAYCTRLGVEISCIRSISDSSVRRKYQVGDLSTLYLCDFLTKLLAEIPNIKPPPLSGRADWVAELDEMGDKIFGKKQKINQDTVSILQVDAFKTYVYKQIKTPGKKQVVGTPDIVYAVNFSDRSITYPFEGTDGSVYNIILTKIKRTFCVIIPFPLFIINPANISIKKHCIVTSGTRRYYKKSFFTELQLDTKKLPEGIDPTLFIGFIISLLSISNAEYVNKVRSQTKKTFRSNKWTMEHLAAVKRLYRPGLSPENKTMLLNITGRTWSTIQKKASDIRYEYYVNGIFDLDVLPHTNVTPSLKKEIEQAKRRYALYR